MRPEAPREADESFGELLGRFGSQIAELVRSELALAKAELSDKARPAIASAGMFAAAGVLGIAAFGALTACFIAALSTVLAVWASALIVAVACAKPDRRFPNRPHKP
jgi:hypothetical protein